MRNAMRRGSPGRGRGAGDLGMKRPEWRAGARGCNSPARTQAGRGVVGPGDPGTTTVAAVTAPITAALIARTRGVADPRWSPTGDRLAWLDSFDGRADLVVAPTDGSTPPIVVTAAFGVAGGWCWAGDDELVVV